MLAFPKYSSAPDHFQLKVFPESDIIYLSSKTQ